MNYMSDMKEYLDNLEENVEISIVPAPTLTISRADLVLFKEDYERVCGYRDRMLRKTVNMPEGPRKSELTYLANTISYMLTKFEVRECASV